MYGKYLTLFSQKGNPVPQIVNWYGKLDVKNVNRNNYKKIPSPLMLEMRSGMDVFYPDVLTSPIMMVSEEAMEVIRLYDSRMPFFFLALFDPAREENISYYCPVLAEDDGGGKEAIFRIKWGDGYVIKICEELAESLLERGVTGMELLR